MLNETCKIGLEVFKTMKTSYTTKQVAEALGVSVSTIIRASKKLKKGVKLVKRGKYRQDRIFSKEAITDLSRLLNKNVQQAEKVNQEGVKDDSLLDELRKRVDSLEQDKKNYIKQIESLTGIINNTNETIKQINNTLQGNLMLSAPNGKEVIEGKIDKGKEKKGNWLVRLLNKKIV